MVVNPSKTEIVIFGKKPPEDVMVNFAGSQVKTSQNMKALGIHLMNNLKWDLHLKEALHKSSAKLALIRKIRPYITMEQFLTVATSQVFSTLYYASTVWLNSTLSCSLFKRIDSFHYRVMRVACNDFKGRRKRKVIDALCKRATPRMWSSYISASTAIKIIRENSPLLIANRINGNMTTNRRRPRNGRLFDASSRSIGKHSFSNRLLHLNDLEEPWLYPSPSDDPLRRILKKHFNFNFD